MGADISSGDSSSCAGGITMATSHRRHRVAYDTLNVAAGLGSRALGSMSSACTPGTQGETSEGTDGPSE